MDRNKRLPVYVIRNVCRKSRTVIQCNHTFCFFLRHIAKSCGKHNFCCHANTKGLSVKELIIADRLYCTSNRMSQIQHFTQSTLALIFHYNIILDLAVVLCDIFTGKFLKTEYII